MLLFVDESGHDRSGTPYEVLAGVAIAESDLWNLVGAVRAAERECFGGYLRDLLSEETKAKKLLKRNRFRLADRDLGLSAVQRVSLANSLLLKGKVARAAKSADAGETREELVAYSRQVLAFTHQVLDIAAAYGACIFATLVDPNAPRPERGQLRKDYVYLFERYFYFLEGLPRDARGLVVFDELEKSQAHGLIQQMAAYFLGTSTGRYRSSRIVPEPFFVHSDLTTGVFLADLAAYLLGWGWRNSRMSQPARPELRPYVEKIHGLQYVGEKPKDDGTGNWQLYGITFLDDLRGQFDRTETS
jgi:hypothetical protein